MVAQIDIWRAAHLLAKRHGADAPIFAAQRADELLAQHDIDGHRIWKRIGCGVRVAGREAGGVLEAKDCRPSPW